MQKFNRWLDGRLAKSPYKSFLVYPEGARLTASQLGGCSSEAQQSVERRLIITTQL